MLYVSGFYKKLQIRATSTHPQSGGPSPLLRQNVLANRKHSLFRKPFRKPSVVTPAKGLVREEGIKAFLCGAQCPLMHTIHSEHAQ